ncbi:hypothetical protein CASFOL_018072 [Castilleja foliolosa]|uniref:Phosphoinositide phospholipase C n=1 Tax=Castilleja foliolosa TaxID=1961234 RepID=A0ABD3DA09_9LAMI
MSKQTYSICFCFKRKFRLKEDEMPVDIKSLFENYSENGLMNVEHLNKFLQEIQGDDDNEAEAVMESILNEHKPLNIFQRKNLSIKQFLQYLLSDINSPLPNPPEVHHDMTAPLSHYFIYTGHNSYLTGNQISSDSSDVPIIEALRRGVRVIELDMWPNSTKDDIHILHGGTLTNPAKVAEMINQTFGDILFCSTSPDSLQDFPSPDSLKGRVIISTKPPKEYLETKSSIKESDTSVKVDNPSPWGKEISHLGAKFSNGGLAYDEDDVDDDQNIIINAAPPTEYKHLIAIQNEKMKGGIKAWLRVDSQKAHRVSLNEEKLEKAVLTHGTEIVRFNQTNLMRVYPKATRIDSSNFNPLIGWIHGAQMVAFNMQGHGRSLWLMQGMFRANGGCGYVKKPDIILNLGPNNEVFDPKRQLPVKKTLKVKIYMGEGWNMDFRRTHFDLYSPPDFYVKIGIAGVPVDSSMTKTKVIEDNWTPVWDEEFEFPLTVPEMALLRIEVHEFDMSEKDDFGGQTCLPVSELKTGIRAIPLHDNKGEKYNSVKLLARFNFAVSQLIAGVVCG